LSAVERLHGSSLGNLPTASWASVGANLLAVGWLPVDGRAPTAAWPSVIDFALPQLPRLRLPVTTDMPRRMTPAGGRQHAAGPAERQLALTAASWWPEGSRVSREGGTWLFPWYACGSIACSLR